jgi:outer membrane protein insertion porin family
MAAARRTSLAAGLALAVCALLGVPWTSAQELPTLGAPMGESDTPPAEETIVDVRVVGLRQMSVEEFLREIRSRPGRTFHLPSIEEDVRSLNATKRFLDVKTLYERPREGEIVVIFQVAERARVEYIRIVGNDAYSNDKLLKEVGFKRGDPLDPYSVDDGRRRLEDFYRKKGYSRVQVTVEEGTRLDDRGVRYLVNEGARQRVWGTRFEGNMLASDARLRTQIQTKPPVLYLFKGFVDEETIAGDVDRLTAYYRSLGYFRARVGRELEYDDDQEWATVTFVIDEGPRYRVRSVSFVGNKQYASNQWEPKLEVRSGDNFDQRDLNRDITQIQDFYGARGHIFADVQADPRFLEEPGELDLVYQIDEGARYRVGEINVQIGGENPHTRIRTVLNRLDLRPGDIVDTRKIRDAERRLKAAGIFANNPAEGKVPKIEIVTPDEDPQLADEGPRVRGQSPDGAPQDRWAEVVVTGDLLPEKRGRPAPAAASPAQPPESDDEQPIFRYQSPDLTWRPPDEAARAGQAPRGAAEQEESPADAVTDERESAGVLRFIAPTRSRRAPQARRAVPAVETEQSPGPQSDYGYPRRRGASPGGSVFRLQSYSGDEGQPRPTLDGGGYTPPGGYVVGQPPGLTPAPPPVVDGGGGDVVLYPDGGELGPYFGQEPLEPFVDLTPQVEETQTGRLLLGVGINSDAGLIGSIVLDEQNFDLWRWPTSWADIANGTAWRGAGQQFRAEAVPGTEVQRYMIQFREPYLFDTPVSFGVSGFYFDRNYSDWDEQRLGGRVSFGYQLTPDLSTTFSFRGENVNIHDPKVPTPPEVVEVLGDNELYGFKLALAHDTRDSAFLPTEGHLLELGVEQVIGSFDYPIATAEARQYFLLHERPDRSGRHVVSVGGQVGFAGSDTPVYDHFFAGGYSTMRGFDFRGASPQVSGVRVGGEFQLLGSVEYLFPITADDGLRAVAFVDFGTVEPDVRLDDDTFRVAPGIGLRITVPGLGPAPIALDLAVPIAHAAGDEIENFNFFIGVLR